MKSNQIKCWFLVREGENRSTGEKPLKAEYENQQTRSDGECGNWTRATLVEGKCSHHLRPTLPPG